MSGVAAVILAAGLSRRMGRPKMTLPWGDSTIIAQVAGVLQQAGLERIVAVTGGAREAVEAALAGLPVQTVFNPHYEQDQMVYSLQVGLAALPLDTPAALVALGDQPHIQVEVARQVLRQYEATGSLLVIPSYQMRRGHPWLIDRRLWPDVLALRPPQTLREVIQAHVDDIAYLEVDTDSILRDLDTPADYQRDRPA